MIPVIILSDGYLANGAEPWRIPDPRPLIRSKLSTPLIRIRTKCMAETNIWPVRGWFRVRLGMEHRIGGLEKQHLTGNVSYDPDNHQMMTDLRHQKIEKVALAIPPIEPHGSASGDLLVLGWGGTYGSIVTAVDNVRKAGHQVSAAHLRHLNPMPSNFGDCIESDLRRCWCQSLIPGNCDYWFGRSTLWMPRVSIKSKVSRFLSRKLSRPFI